ncbi:hypothetical protein [Bradyrhizobium sp. 195]|uniref:hypothetical protein n=1 Tax=Bradyrhizobium sp. 195 TaxID=2782662 RepID=UPI00200187E5|nr:hypothetical protein [Bradyrhizobium sp. 195]UPK29428.1 hypothetical protein IVB26_13850 [Bradyrhizobium sp. 195]
MKVRGDFVVFPMFLLTVIFAIISLWVNIKLARARVGRWDSNSTARFMMSVGNFGDRQVAMWRRVGGYSETEANTIIGYQFLSLAGMLLGFFVSVVLGIFMIA